MEGVKPSTGQLSECQLRIMGKGHDMYWWRKETYEWYVLVLCIQVSCPVLGTVVNWDIGGQIILNITDM